jgi:crotonobetainyl-CoA:carnitine CoA-transferase CaiB-like acyl-CoA transferase
MQRHAPLLGEHNDELLAELGVDPAPLRAAGVIAAAAPPD